MVKGAVALALLLALASLGCMQEAENRKSKLCFESGDCLSVELLESDYARRKGLMGRDALGGDEGVLLVWDEPGIYGEWMKNMLIPTDFIWIGADKRIIHIYHSLNPCGDSDCPTYLTPSPALYGLEVNAGYAKEKGLKPGMAVTLGEL